jgi:hypothetical protein
MEALTADLTARFGPGGRYHLAAHPVVRETGHLLSRGKDPQIHSHLDVLGVVNCPADGKTRALQSRQVYDGQKLFETVYQLELGNGLMRLGYAVEQKIGVAVLRDVPRSLCRAFSSRSEQIREYVQKLGVDSPVVRTLAALATRPEKTAVDPRSLSPAWLETARRHGFSPEQIRPRAVVETRLKTPFGREAEGVKLTVRAADELAARQGQFTKSEWEVRATRLAIASGLTYPDVHRAVTRVSEKPALYGVSSVPRAGQEPLYTTRAAKPYLDRLATRLKEALTPGEGSRVRDVYSSVLLTARDLGEGVRTVAERVVRNPVTMALGPAAGKVASAVREVYGEFRHPLTRVRADTPAADRRSVDRLLRDLRPTPRRQAHLEAVKAAVREPLTRWRSVNDLLGFMEAVYRRERQPKVTLPRRAVVVVEKAGSATPEQLSELFKRVVGRSKARLVLVEQADLPKSALVELARRVGRTPPEQQLKARQEPKQEQTR